MNRESDYIPQITNVSLDEPIQRIGGLAMGEYIFARLVHPSKSRHTERHFVPGDISQLDLTAHALAAVFGGFSGTRPSMPFQAQPTDQVEAELSIDEE